MEVQSITITGFKDDEGYVTKIKPINMRIFSEDKSDNKKYAIAFSIEYDDLVD